MNQGLNTIDAFRAVARCRLRRSLGILVVACVLISCNREEPAVHTRSESFPSSEARNATTVFLTGSVVTTRIRSERIVQYAAQDSAWGFALTVDFFDSSGAHTAVMRADSALVRERQRFLEVFGGVKITTDDGRTLETDHLLWNDQDRTISTDGFVTMTKGKDVMSGYGFLSDPELTHIRLRRQVKGRISDTKALQDTL